MKTLTATILCTLSLATGVAATAAAQDTAAAAGCIVREQAEQIIATLSQRNEQLVATTGNLRAAEQRIAELEIKAAEAETANKALQVAALRNRELVTIGNAIIDDYESMKLGEKVAAREPLTGLYRVQLENKLQQFEEEIAAQRFFPARELEAAAQSVPTPTN